MEYLDLMFTQAAASELYVNKYVEVFGHLRMVDSALCLMAFRIRPLINYNQVWKRHGAIILEHTLCMNCAQVV